MTRIKRILAACSLLCLPLIPAYARNMPDLLPVTTTLRNGETKTYNTRDARVKFLTNAGEIEFLLSDLSQITRKPERALYNVKTAHGDSWLTALLTKTFNYYLDTPKSFFEIEEITFPYATLWAPHGYPLLILLDKTSVYLDPDYTVFKVKDNNQHTWLLPVNSLQSLTFDGYRNGENTSATARFASGRTETFTTASSKAYFKTRDSFGNVLEIHYRDIIEIKGTETQPVVTNTVLQASPFQPDSDTRITSKDGTETYIHLPMSVLTLKGSLGSILLPTPIVCQITKAHDDPRHRLITAYGEHFQGKIYPKQLSIPSSGSTVHEKALKLSDLAAVYFPTPKLGVPQGWFLWQLKNGDVFFARFTDSRIEISGNKTKTGTPVPGILPENIHSIIRSSRPDSSRKTGNDKNIFEITFRDKTSRLCNPSSRKINLILLVNGKKCDVPWSDIVSITSDTAKLDDIITAANTPATTSNLKQDKRKQAVTADPTPRKQKKSYDMGAWSEIKTIKKYTPTLDPDMITITARFTKLKLNRETLNRIHSDFKSSVSCYTTIYGDVFTCPILSRKQYAGILQLPNIPKQIPSLTTFENPQQQTPPGWLAWRLTSGDMFYARVAESIIHVQAEAVTMGKIGIISDSLVSVTRNKNNGFVFKTTGDEIKGTPASSSVQLTLLCNNDTCSVPWKLVERIESAPLQDMPPSPDVIPGVTPLQEGTVLIPAGTFMIGRTQGEGMPDEWPPHKITLSSFYMDACEITKAQFAKFTDDTGYKTDAEKARQPATWKNPGFLQRDDEPVTCVSWFDAAQFCNWRSKKAQLKSCYEFKKRGKVVICHRDRNGYRLPSEAEWEYAAKNAGNDILYPWGNKSPLTDSESSDKTTDQDQDDSKQYPQFPANFSQKEGEPQDNWTWTNPVKSFPPNDLGLYGIAGNVWEWCNDWYFENAYTAVYRRDPVNPCVELKHITGLTRRSMRGGSFQNDIDMLRCASRGNGLPHASNSRVGFRCVRN